MSTDQRDFLDSLTNEELLGWYEIATHDLNLAAVLQPNTEWHEQCFAATFALGQELVARGLAQPVTVH